MVAGEIDNAAQRSDGDASPASRRWRTIFFSVSSVTNSARSSVSVTLYSDYTALIYPEEKDRWIRLSTSIKRKFRLKKRTRLHLSVERFDDLVNFLIREKLAKTPVGQKHIENGTRICRTFEDYRHGKM